MIRVLAAHTLEIDDEKAAVQDILRQLDLKNNLLKNSVGLLFCYLDFINSGVVKALCEQLPFDTAGCTSQGFGVPGAAEEIMLTLMVLTSDDLAFNSGLSEPLVQDEQNRIVALYQNLKAGAPDPSLLFAFSPTIPNLTGNTVIDTLDRESKGVPVFGTLAVDFAEDVRSPMTLYNGGAYPDRLSLISLSGDLKPKFFTASLPGEQRLNQKALITKSEGNRLITLDNKPAEEYLEKVGLHTKGSSEALYGFPIVVDYPGSKEPRVFTIYKINDDGSLVSETSMPEGGVLSIGNVTSDLVFETAVRITDLIKNEADQNGFLLFSCFSRSVILADSQSEIKLIQKRLGDFSTPYLILYSGGELCPLYGEAGQTMNRFHQYTIIGCTF